MRTLFISLLGLSLAAVGWAAPVTITSYDIVDAVQSGHGSWSHTYGGTIVPGASFSNSGYGGTLATYSGGTGTLADGILGTATGNTQLFVQGPASDGTSINPVITIYLSGIFSINSISIFGGPDENSIPGCINGVTVGLGGSSAALATTQFGSGGGADL